jgi:hypothetical protein
VGGDDPGDEILRARPSKPPRLPPLKRGLRLSGLSGAVQVIFRPSSEGVDTIHVVGAYQQGERARQMTLPGSTVPA